MRAGDRQSKQTLLCLLRIFCFFYSGKQFVVDFYINFDFVFQIGNDDIGFSFSILTWLQALREHAQFKQVTECVNYAFVC